ncbi:MAG: NYN domain-containing protein [Patescibacteria group bacterium]|nr:NYN domain-containing protein [Patescibacteria group bacterium]
MFTSKIARIEKLAKKFPGRIAELDDIFDRTTNVYIDYANVRPWVSKLGWHIDLKRLKQLLNSFDTIQAVKFYNGTLAGDVESEAFMAEIEHCGFDVHTKSVKKMNLSIDVSSIPSNSPDILKDFIRKPLLQKLKIETIEFLNGQLKELNNQGILSVEDLKCNFDVEIGRDMLLDDKNDTTNFVLWSGDSDFADPVQQLLRDGKKVALFATARRVSSELGALTKKGLFIFDIQKIKNFICWKKEITS